MNKRQLIDEIIRINRTARPSFLARFDEGDLDEYLRHLLDATVEAPLTPVCDMAVCGAAVGDAGQYAPVPAEAQPVVAPSEEPATAGVRALPRMRTEADAPVNRSSNAGSLATWLF